MSRSEHTLSPTYFEDQYRTNIDPWQFRSSKYEKEKFASTNNALSRPRYHSALEVGCSIGVLSTILSPRCNKLLAIDASATAIEEARRQTLPNVDFEVRFLPVEFPDGKFDLIVLSEVLYYFSLEDLRCVANLSLNVLTPDADVILCHWLGETDYPLSGQQASDQFALAIEPALPFRTVLRDEVYRLERFAAVAPQRA